MFLNHSIDHEHEGTPRDSQSSCRTPLIREWISLHQVTNPYTAAYSSFLLGRYSKSQRITSITPQGTDCQYRRPSDSLGHDTNHSNTVNGLQFKSAHGQKMDRTMRGTARHMSWAEREPATNACDWCRFGYTRSTSVHTIEWRKGTLCNSKSLLGES